MVKKLPETSGFGAMTASTGFGGVSSAGFGSVTSTAVLTSVFTIPTSFGSSAPVPIVANVAKKKHVSIRAGADDYDDDVDDDLSTGVEKMTMDEDSDSDDKDAEEEDEEDDDDDDDDSSSEEEVERPIKKKSGMVDMSQVATPHRRKDRK
eukprot:scaffold4701_cov227-Ochromonas_danica.AAC.4